MYDDEYSLDYCSDHFVISTNTESLPYTPETNVISIIPQ